jgi:hypothetical protein
MHHAALRKDPYATGANRFVKTTAAWNKTAAGKHISSESRSLNVLRHCSVDPLSPQFIMQEGPCMH